MEIGVVLFGLAHHAADALHDGLLIDIGAVPHEVGGAIVVVDLTVDEVETRYTDHEETVANELHLTLCVAKFPVRKAVSYEEKLCKD